MNSKIVFGQYYHAQSWIHKLDPRTKLICLFSLMISIFLITNLYILLGMLGLIIVLVLFSKIPVRSFSRAENDGINDVYGNISNFV